VFTGIVAAVGSIEAVTPLNLVAQAHAPMGVSLRIHAAKLDLRDLIPGSSIAVQGACMTIVQLDPPYFSVEVSAASLGLTHGLDRLGRVNLEKALRLSDRLDGHIATGHIDGLGRVVQLEERGESRLLGVLAPPNLARYLAYKGSVSIDGVSLTVNEAEDTPQGCVFQVNLIAHTVNHTTLQDLQLGDAVNLEVDLVARYVERMLACRPS
jgi:riboflavin synthase